MCILKNKEFNIYMCNMLMQFYQLIAQCYLNYDYALKNKIRIPE